MTLSVSMIVRDEEACLEACLRSVVGNDDLVVVDTGSTDRTGLIASIFGARQFTFPWIDDFAAARNYSLQQCRGDWVLVVDADEELEPGGIEKIKEAIERAEAAGMKTVGVRCESKRGREVHMAPRVFRRCPEVYWKGAIHNYLSVAEDNPSDITIRYGYSEAHAKDPDRALRILTKVMEENPNAVREAYYLAREYWYRKKYEEAIGWYDKYLTRATWAPEMADAWLMLARCLWATRMGDKARNACLQAIKINADFKEALLFMSEMSGPKNREYWKLYASMATNKDVLFVREAEAKPAEYYNRLFGASRDMSRYDKLLQSAASWSSGRVLDVCCGTGDLGKYIDDYHGIDFSREAIGEDPRLQNGDVFELDLSGYDTYVLLETLEHVDDLALLAKLPVGANVVFSVPSFTDPAHIRTYNERIARVRFGGIMRIDQVKRFNWTGAEWDDAHADTGSYILLVQGCVRPL